MEKKEFLEYYELYSELDSEIYDMAIKIYGKYDMEIFFAAFRNGVLSQMEKQKASLT